MSCTRAQEFLATHEVETKQEIDAKKERYGAEDALQLTVGMSKLIVAKGKKVTTVDLKRARPDDKELVALLLGPTGNLRAPTLKVGKIMLVGFNAESYENALHTS